MNKRFTWRSAAMLFACFATVVSFTGLAQAGTVILEGSDAIEYHCTEYSVPGACTYEAQVWKALDGSSGKPIAVIEGNDPVALSSEGSGITIDNFTSVAAAGSLSSYAAVYIEGDNGDNAGPEGDTAVLAAGAASTLSSYLSGGGTVMIEDYTGGSAFDPIVGTSGGANGDVAGAYGGSSATSTACSDGEKVTPVGTANGFTQPPVLSCWEHQAYNESFFSSLGFTKSFFDAGSDMVSGEAGWSGLLSSGSTVTGAAAEPSSLMLLACVALLLGVFLGKRRIYQQE